MKLSEFIKNISENIISVHGSKNIDVDFITNDSRKVVDNTIFVAIKGAGLDGHNYIEKAVLAGACIVVFKDKPDFFIEDVTYIEVDDTYLVYALLAETYFQFPASKLKIIGITGTNGKTTCAFLINHILNYAGFKTGLISTVQYSYGNKILPALRTTPEAFELQGLFFEMSRSCCEYAVMEVSSHSLSQHRLGKAEFAAVLFTNLSGDHLDYHGNMENYFQAKKQIFKMHSTDSKNESIKIINLDDIYGTRLISELTGKRVVSFGCDKKSNISFVCGSTGTITGLFIKDRIYNIETSLIGKFNAYNIAGSVALCIELGIPFDIVVEALKGFTSVPGRLELFYTSTNARCFVDYAHTDDALKRVLAALKGLNPSRVIVVFGCGGDRDKSKRPRMGKVASEYADVVVITDDNPRTENSSDIINDIISGGLNPEKKIKVIPNRKEAITYAVGIAKKDDIILIAGKGHEDYQEIGTKRYPLDDRDVVKKCMILDC